MNIFYVDKCPIKAAQHLVDNHVNKMVLESAQLLANCYSLERLAEKDCPRTQKGNTRKHSYYNHPCSKWVRKDFHNWYWLVMHALSLEQERIYRGFNPHFSGQFICWCVDNPPNLPCKIQTFPALAIDEKFKGSDPVQSYRDYYNFNKRYQTTLPKVWTRRGQPSWWLTDERAKINARLFKEK